MVVRIGQRLAPMLPWGGDRVGGGSGGGGWGSEMNSGLLNMRRHSGSSPAPGYESDFESESVGDHDDPPDPLEYSSKMEGIDGPWS